MGQITVLILVNLLCSILWNKYTEELLYEQISHNEIYVSQ